MSFSRHSAGGLVTIALSLLAAGPAAASVAGPAAASVAGPAKAPGTARLLAAIPADCTLRGLYPFEVTLTCTARPATQQWELEAGCLLKPGVYTLRFGNVVTGDGTSTIPTCLGATNEVFVPLQ